MATYSALRTFGWLAVLLLVGGCATLPRSAPPAESTAEFQIVGMPGDIRSTGLGPSEALQTDFSQALVTGGTDAQCDSKDGEPILLSLIHI